MLRSLFTGITGLNAHQQMLDITSNNIANVNTTGYKSSSAVFEDALSQTLSGGTAPAASQGGADPTQVGLGVKLAGSFANFDQGSAQVTGVTSNLMIEGDGFFVVDKDGSQAYTRSGAFTLDSAGNLTLPDGSKAEDVNGNVLDLSALTNGSYVSWSIDQNGNVNAVDSAGATTTLGQIGLATFPNPNGLLRIGDTEFQATANSGAADVGAARTGSRGSLTSGYVEMSNVDLSRELTNLIIAERGYQANSKVITTSDEILQTLVNLKQ
jgi:flagellar hook protein FlgE